MKTYLRLLVIASGVLIGQGCRKDPLNHLSSAESRIFITQHDTAISFSSYKTFSVSDSVLLLVNDQNAGSELDSADSLFISNFTTSMQTAGFTLVPKNDSPDLAVNLTHLSENYIGVTYFSDYGNYWDPYYWGYGGYGYDFPYYYSAYQVNEDAMAFDMFDLKNAADNGNKLVDVWSALIKGQDIFSPANIPAEVDTLFAQSSYLKQ
jgi:hypothetical protein